ncbi:MAG: tail fiber protein [Bacteroidales bacterium]|nr:tail fiber protein [Bacteroidales bacterium]
MGQIIKYQQEAFNGQLVNGSPDYDILYPKTSADQVEGLAALIQQLFPADSDTKVQSITLTEGTSSAGPKITVTLTDGTSVTSTTINIASTSKHGVTKLTSAVNSTSEALAATAKAVKTAYDLANTANTTANTNSTNLTNLHTNLEDKCLKVVTYNDLSILNRITSLTLDEKIKADNLVNVIAFNVSRDGSTVTIVNEGVTFGIVGGKLQVNSTAITVNRVKVVYEYTFV